MQTNPEHFVDAKHFPVGWRYAEPSKLTALECNTVLEHWETCTVSESTLFQWKAVLVSGQVVPVETFPDGCKGPGLMGKKAHQQIIASGRTSRVPTSSTLPQPSKEPPLARYEMQVEEDEDQEMVDVDFDFHDNVSSADNLSFTDAPSTSARSGSTLPMLERKSPSEVGPHREDRVEYLHHLSEISEYSALVQELAIARVSLIEHSLAISLTLEYSG